MMGAGKSTIGRRMAARLKLTFTDADTEIETAAGMAAELGPRRLFVNGASGKRGLRNVKT